ncbi:unnamed protein product [Amoebophrya sp. A120]|nr:unnamed protein product [Amoebophrya sp. A120]|eukprot:GSA120T00001083001.1
MSVDETSYYRPLYNRNGPVAVEEEELLPAGGPASTVTAPQMLTSTPLASSSSCEASTNTEVGCEVVDNNCSSAPSAATGSGRARLKNRKLIKMGPPTTPGTSKEHSFGIGETTKGPFLSSSPSSSYSGAANQNHLRQERHPNGPPYQQPTATELCRQILQLGNVSARSTTDGSRDNIAVNNFRFPREQQAVEDLFRRPPTPPIPNALLPVQVDRLREQGLDAEPWFERMQSEEMSMAATTLQDRTDNDHAEQGLVPEHLPVHVSCWPPENEHRRAFLEGHRGATGTTPIEISGTDTAAPPSWSTSGSCSLAMHPPHIFNLRYCNNETASSPSGMAAAPGFEEQVTEPQFQPFVPMGGGEIGAPAMGSSFGSMLRLAQLLRQPSSYASQAEANGLREVMAGPGLVPAMEQGSAGPQQAEQQRVLDHLESPMTSRDPSSPSSTGGERMPILFGPFPSVNAANQLEGWLQRLRSRGRRTSSGFENYDLQNEHHNEQHPFQPQQRRLGLLQQHQNVGTTSRERSSPGLLDQQPGQSTTSAGAAHPASTPTLPPLRAGLTRRSSSGGTTTTSPAVTSIDPATVANLTTLRARVYHLQLELSSREDQLALLARVCEDVSERYPFDLLSESGMRQYAEHVTRNAWANALVVCPPWGMYDLRAMRWLDGSLIFSL